MIKKIKSEMLKEEYNLVYKIRGYMLSSSSVDDGELEDEYDVFNQALYRSNDHLIYFENRTWEEEEDELLDIDELVKECFESDESTLYFHDEYYEALKELNNSKDTILKIYQFYDRTVNFVFIKDKKLFDHLRSDKIFFNNPEIIRTVDEYIYESSENSKEGYICARIIDKEYSKYKND